MYNSAKKDIYSFLGKSSHRKRLSKMNLEEDIIYCLQMDQTDIVPVLKGDLLVSNKS